MGSNNCSLNPLEVLKGAISGGITMFQFREKGEGSLEGEEKIKLARDLQILCKRNNIPFIVNDDVDLALLLDADGVHIGQEDESAELVRKKIGDKILGVSAHNIDEVRLAVNVGADYIGMGPVFPTSSKLDAKDVQGTIEIEKVRSNGINIPLVGIGGITKENASFVIKGGADGVSVISAISLSSSPLKSTKELLFSLYED